MSDIHRVMMYIAMKRRCDGSFDGRPRQVIGRIILPCSSRWLTIRFYPALRSNARSRLRARSQYGWSLVAFADLV